MKLIVPVPAPNAMLGAVSVPGAAAGAPAPAPMLSVPIAPGFVAILTGPVTTPPSAIVSVPVPNYQCSTRKCWSNWSPRRPPSPYPASLQHCRCWRPKLVLLKTVPPFVIVSEPVPKLPILSPPLTPLIQLEPGPVTVTVPVEPAANPTEPPPLLTVPPSWIVSMPVPWPPTTTLPAFDQLDPAPLTVTVPSPPGRLPMVPKEVAQCPAGQDCKHSCPV